MRRRSLAPFTSPQDLPIRSHRVRISLLHVDVILNTKIWLAVYIYRTVLDSINGVSSTRATSVASITLEEGEIRQLQFVEDDTLMVLWTDGSMFSALDSITCIH